jgi:outer membrane protein TolC
MRFPGRRFVLNSLVFAAAGLGLGAGPNPGPPSDQATGVRAVSGTPVLSAEEPPSPCPGPRAVLLPPVFTEGQPPPLPPGQLEAGEKPLPINLATALRLGDARPLVIAAAQASLREAVARYDQARVLWLPDVYLGASYYRHDGGTEGQSGNFFINGKDQFLAGGGLMAVVSTADAIFAPLALRQVVRSRQMDVQASRNEALQTVAEAYFNVQQARGQLAAAHDVVERGRQLARTVAALSKDLAPPIEVNRVRGELADLEQTESFARERWRVASRDLTRALRLDPAAVVVPLEPPDLRVTLIRPEESIDGLIPIALTNRPELASQQALVQATLARLREARLRPLLPSVVLSGNPSPAAEGGFLMGGVFGSDLNGHANPWSGREDVNVQLLWELRNFGFGDRAAVRERQAEEQRAVIELFRVQDRVAAEVAQAHDRLASAAVRVGEAETGLKETQVNYAGNLKGLGETNRFGDVLVLVTRPQEAVAALRQLGRAYDNYYLAANDYNRAQFQLYWALGYAAGILACSNSLGDVRPVDTTRPPPMAPACAPEPCQHCPR